MKHILILFLSFFFFSCSTVNRSHNNSAIDIQIESKMQAQIDVDVTQKLTGYAYGGYLFNIFKVSGDKRYAHGMDFKDEGSKLFRGLSRVEQVKAAAAYNAIRQSEADILVSPQYVVEASHWNPFWKSIKVKVTGHPGRVVAIRNRN